MIQYMHFVVDRRTLCFELPDYSLIETEVVKAITDNFHKPLVTINVGLAKCHPEDQFRKATGREISYSNMEPIDFDITWTSVMPEKNEVKVTLENNNLIINLVLRKSFSNVRILSAYEK